MMMSLLKRVCYTIACTAGVHHVSRWLNRKRLVILAYHAISPNGNTSPLVVAQKDFNRQLDYLRRYYRILPVDAALEQLHNGGLHAATACITFDDGYRNNLTNALPALRRAKAPATIFLSTGYIGAQRPLWTTAVAAMFASSKVGRVDLSVVGLGVLALDSPQERRRAATQTIDRLKRAAQPERAKAISALTAALGGEVPTSTEPFVWLDWNEIKSLDDEQLVSFGAHTVHHEIVSRLDDDQLEYEVSESVATLDAKVSNRSQTFAYPNGRAEDFDLRAQEAVRRTGMAAALSTIDGLNDVDTNSYALRRIVVGGDMNFNEFRLATCGLLSWLRTWARP